jgi:hypothetical protein
LRTQVGAALHSRLTWVTEPCTTLEIAIDVLSNTFSSDPLRHIVVQRIRSLLPLIVKNSEAKDTLMSYKPLLSELLDIIAHEVEGGIDSRDGNRKRRKTG